MDTPTWIQKVHDVIGAITRAITSTICPHPGHCRYSTPFSDVQTINSTTIFTKCGTEKKTAGGNCTQEIGREMSTREVWTATF